MTSLENDDEAIARFKNEQDVLTSDFLKLQTDKQERIDQFKHLQQQCVKITALKAEFLTLDYKYTALLNLHWSTDPADVTSTTELNLHNFTISPENKRRVDISTEIHLLVLWLNRPDTKLLRKSVLEYTPLGRMPKRLHSNSPEINKLAKLAKFAGSMLEISTQTETQHAAFNAALTPGETKNHGPDNKAAFAESIRATTMDCPICFNAFTIGNRLSCHHAFHFHCIGKWAQTNRSCPLCRAKVVSNDLVLK
jgi:hypothetical protein